MSCLFHDLTGGCRADEIISMTARAIENPSWFGFANWLFPRDITHGVLARYEQTKKKKN